MSRLKTPLCEELGIEYPIVQAGMGRGTVNLAAAVSNAGGLGTIGIPEITSTPREMRRTIENNLDVLTEKTDGSFAVNCLLLAPHKVPDELVEGVDEYIEGALVSKLTDDDVAEGMRVLETSGASPEPWIDEINSVTEDTDLLHFHKVGSVKHAKKAVELGVDGVTASGYEMGGHTHHPESAVHTFVLVPAIAEAVDVPVVASGGIRTGGGLLAALCLGAEAGYMGSRFLMTQECDFHENYKEYIADSGEWDDTVVDGFVAPARVIDSPGIEDLKRASEEMDPDEFREYKDKTSTSARNYGEIDEGLIVAGQTATYIDDVPTVSELVDEIVAEAVETHAGLDIEA